MVNNISKNFKEEWIAYPSKFYSKHLFETDLNHNMKERNQVILLYRIC